MHIVRLVIDTSDTARLQVDYGKKRATIALEGLEKPEGPEEVPWDSFYKKCLTELFDAIQAKDNHWTRHPPADDDAG